MRLFADSYVLLLLGLLFVVHAAAETATIRKLRVTRAADKTQLEVILTSPITPLVTVATNPDRLIVDFPATLSLPRQKRIAVNRNGVRQVRLGLYSAKPPVTRAVADLDWAHPYTVTTVGNSVIVVVLGTVNGTRHRSKGAVPAATASPLARLWPQPAPRPGTSSAPATPSDADLHPSFKVRYVAEGAAYLNGGRSSGLAEGMTLLVHELAASGNDDPNPQGTVVAELQIVSLAETSSVAEIHNPRRPLKPGDWAELSQADYARLGEKPAPNLAVSSLPQPESAVMPENDKPVQHPTAEGRVRARVALDYSGLSSSGSTPGRSASVGLAIQTDSTHIAGTHWNLQGYWRGRLTTNSQPDESTIQNYLDRTYIIQLYYDNPGSRWVAGFGRLYLPWAASLDTIDGGYGGRKITKEITAGIFFGSTPNPATWNYRPDQQIAGTFVNFEGGSLDNVHYTSTAGVALSFLKWQLDRPYLFLENAVSYSRHFSIYHSLIVDSPQGASTGGIAPGTGINRSYLTLRIEPRRWIGLELVHNYFRDVPTAATALIGTGTVDKLLYQGFNGTVRINLAKNVSVYTTVGRSDKTGDLKRSLNQNYGLALKDVGHSGIRADFHYSKFDSSFAGGIYRILSLSRSLGNRVMWDVQFGSQSLTSAFTVNQHSVFVDSSFDTNLTRHTFLQSGYTIEHGTQMSYDQWHLSLGYRFDTKGPVK